MTSLVFAGAEHSRFVHALGSAHIMVSLQAQLRKIGDILPLELRLDEESAADALAAALLHDLGHGPFSHLWEGIFPQTKTHEAWTVETIQDCATEVHVALERLSQGMAERVASLLTGQHRLNYLGGTISGTLDVDRCDYLLRDSHMTGVRY